jgi:hypothetical protein
VVRHGVHEERRLLLLGLLMLRSGGHRHITDLRRRPLPMLAAAAAAATASAGASEEGPQRVEGAARRGAVPFFAA